VFLPRRDNHALSCALPLSGPVKSMLLRSDLNEIRRVIYAARDRGDLVGPPRVLWNICAAKPTTVRRLP